MTPTPSSRARGLGGAMVDCFTGWSLGLPAETCSYTVRAIRIPLDDGIELASDLYLSTGSHKLGTLLVVGPYGRGLPLAISNARIFASRGYHVLYVSTRGTYGSGGVFDPGRTDAADSQDVVAWMKQQEWYTGSFATLGNSYSGFTQWALLENQPTGMIASAVFAGPHDFSRLHWGPGTFNLDLIPWVDSIVYQEDFGFVRSAIQMVTAKKRLQPILDAVPLADAIAEHFSGRAPWFQERLMRPELTDPFWKPMQLNNAVGRASLPILLNTGWYDVFFEQTMEQYTSLRQRGVHVGLTVGPWAHMEVCNSDTMGQTLQWLGAAFDNNHGGCARKAPVRIYVTGAAEWRDMPEWPPLTIPRELHLGPAGGLYDMPTETGSATEFIFHPELPTPTIGGPLLVGGGSFDDTALSKRSDVLVFTSRPLEENVEILGKPQVVLFHSRDNPNADLFLRLSELNGKGISRNITETYMRLDNNVSAGLIDLHLLDCAHRFQKGSSIRLMIAGGSHPRFARSLGTGENPTTGATSRSVSYTVHYGGPMISKVVLPMLSS